MEIDPGGGERRKHTYYVAGLDAARVRAAEILAEIRGYSEVIR